MKFDSVEELRTWIVARVARLTGVHDSAVDSGERLQRLGLDSLRVTTLLAELGVKLGRVLSPTLAWAFPTPDALARHLVSGDAPALEDARRERRLDDEPIAIVGIACRLPQASSPRAFWELLAAGVDAITEVPPRRWNIDETYDADPTAPGKMSTRWGGFLTDVETFDAAFFGIPPREAAQIDPQQRLALELSWEALEDAGIPPTSLKDTRTGVFFGAMWMDYARLAARSRDEIMQYTATGQDLSVVPARISYTLGLLGPSIAVNTACSSSLVAVHLACQSLLRGECRAALAGGVNLMIAPESTIVMSKFGAMAPDGRSKAFDARANGYVRGEGGGVVVLKRLSDARADGDRVYCVIRGTAVNNDGFSNGLTAPSPRAQEAVLKDACAAAGVEPNQVQYVEAHGTGTMLGDPIEAGALGAVFGVNRSPERALRIGSVKTNIGHLEAAAGMAGLLKVVLTMHHRTLVPSLHFERPNPHIPFDALGLRVQTTKANWDANDGSLLAGVSSFGFGGTNCHVVLEKETAEPARLFALSAVDEATLRAEVVRIADALRVGADTLDTACRPLPAEDLGEWRLAVSVKTASELERQLRAFAEGSATTAMSAGRVASRPPRVAFVFGGQGSQWPGMGRALMDSDPVARAVLTRCDRAFRAYVPWSLLERLREADPAHFEDVTFLQPAIFAMQVALAEVWRARGVEPVAVVGQSMGEVAAAHVAGALTLEDASRVICLRSRVVSTGQAGGKMAVVGLSLQATAEVLAPFAGRLTVCVSSAPDSTVIGGDGADVEEVVRILESQGVFCRLVRVDYASHTPRMDPLLPELGRVLAPVAPRRAQRTIYSTVSAGPIDGQTLDATYWAANLREPVLFAPAIERLAAEAGINVFVEVGPHGVVDQNVVQCLAHGGYAGIVVPSARRDEQECDTLLEASGRLFLAGVPVRASRRDEDRSDAPTILPLSAKSPLALNAQARRLREHLVAREDLSIRDVAFSAATTRSALGHRLALVAHSRSELLAALEAAAQGEAPPGARRGEREVRGAERPKLAFLFTGQGAQSPGMGKALCDAWPAFREAFERSVALFDRELGSSLLEVMWAEPGSPEASRLDDTMYTQPALFCLEWAFSALWQSWNVVPDFVCGHSIGEIVAACVAGVFSLEDAVRLVAARGRWMSALPRGGAMIAIEAKESVVAGVLAESPLGKVSISAVNSPTSVVIAGAESAVLAVSEIFAARGVRTKRLAVSHAFHSELMEPMLEEFESVARTITYARPSISLVSNITGRFAEAEVAEPSYWVRHVRETVRFLDGVRAAYEAGTRMFVELGPRATLLGAVPACLPGTETEVTLVPSLRSGRDEATAVLEALGGAWTAGACIDWPSVFPDGGPRIALPTYAWQRERYWVDSIVKMGGDEDELAPRSVRQVAANGEIVSATLRRLASSGKLSASARAALPELLAAFEQDLALSLRAAELDPWLYAVAWRALEKPASPSRFDGKWLVVGRSPDADAISAALSRAGATAAVVDGREAPHVLRQGAKSFRGVLVLCDGPNEVSENQVLAIQQVLAAEVPVAPRATWVTRGAIGTGPTDPPTSPQQAVIWGLGRAFALEHPHAWGGLIDLPSGPLTTASADDVASIVSGAIAEDQVALRSSKAFAARIAQGALERDRPVFSTNGTVLVTGGLGGLGLQVARWLAGRGVKHFLLTSRRGWQTPGVEVAVAELEALGASVRVAAANVTDRHAMEAALRSIPREAPLSAVFHVAGLADKTPLRELTSQRLADVLLPKREGTIVLEELTGDSALDAFVCFSSVAGVWGASRQAAYAASNAFLDAWAQAARARGLRAFAVSWGPWEGEGMADDAFRAQLARRGLRALAPGRALDALERVLTSNASHAIVADVDWPKFRQSFEATGTRMLLREIAPDADDKVPVTDATHPLRELLAKLSAPERERSLRTWLTEQCLLEMGFAPGTKLDPERGFFEIGMDSLMIVGLRRTVERALGARLSVSVAFEYPSVNALSKHLVERCGSSSLPPPVSSMRPPARTYPPRVSSAAEPISTNRLDDAPDSEVMAVLDRELAKVEWSSPT